MVHTAQLDQPHLKAEVTALLIVLVISILFIAPSAILAASSPQTLGVTVPSGTPVYVITPSHSNLTVLSVNGQQYETSLSRLQPGYVISNNGVPVTVPSLIGGEEFAFTPRNSSVYSVELGIGSSGTAYALVLLGSPSGNVFRNVSSSSSFELALTVTATPSQAQSQGWNPLFGLTGIGTIGFEFTSVEGLIFLSVVLVALFTLGVRYSKKFLGLGLLLLFGIGLVLVGLVIEGLVLAIYLASFIAVRAYFGFRGRSRASEREDEP